MCLATWATPSPEETLNHICINQRQTQAAGRRPKKGSRLSQGDSSFCATREIRKSYRAVVPLLLRPSHPSSVPPLIDPPASCPPPHTRSHVIVRRVAYGRPCTTNTHVPHATNLMWKRNQDPLDRANKSPEVDRAAHGVLLVQSNQLLGGSDTQRGFPTPRTQVGPLWAVLRPCSSINRQ